MRVVILHFVFIVCCGMPSVIIGQNMISCEGLQEKMELWGGEKTLLTKTELISKNANNENLYIDFELSKKQLFGRLYSDYTEYAVGVRFLNNKNEELIIVFSGLGISGFYMDLPELDLYNFFSCDMSTLKWLAKNKIEEIDILYKKQKTRKFIINDKLYFKELVNCLIDDINKKKIKLDNSYNKDEGFLFPKINFPNLPKTIEITDVKQFDLEVCIQSPNAATETKLYVNNQLYPLRGIGKGSDDDICSETIKRKITLSGYNIHTIKVVSTNEFGTTTAEKLIQTVKGYDASITIPKGKNYALFIGITDYEHRNDLYNPVNDCKALIKVLSEEYNFDRQNISTLYDEAATRKNVLDKIEQFATDLSPSDNLLIYFAGHGYYEDKHKRGSWIPYEATQTATFSDMITNNEVKDKLCLLDGNNVYVIADACFSGSMIKKSQALEIPKDLEPWVRELQQQKSVRVFASGQLERVNDVSVKNANHSPFAYFFLKILKENTSDVLLAASLEFALIKAVQPETKQRPEGAYIDDCKKGDNKGQFIFYRKK
jgi:hypothetical protein